MAWIIIPHSFPAIRLCQLRSLSLPPFPILTLSALVVMASTMTVSMIAHHPPQAHPHRPIVVGFSHRILHAGTDS